MISTPLDKEMISQPELWRLTLLLKPGRLDVALYPPVPREEMIWRSFEFDAAAPSPLRAIEDVIYANPLLFSDFKQVDCLIDNCPAILLPAALGPDDLALAYDRSTAIGSSDSLDDPEIYPSGCDSTVVVLRQQAEIKAFLLRTFYNIRFHSRLAALTSYLLSANDMPAQSALYVFAREGRLTLIAADGPRLLLANDFSYETETDALYYILAVRRMLGLDPATSPVLTSPVPQSFTSLLRQHVDSVGSIPFPMLRFRTTQATLQAPFDLIIRSVCE
ncbi:MAG: DUF3822 family protein [Bacteroides sp.]|nr:DUF3822 family protein [Bacteroides sp.]